MDGVAFRLGHRKSLDGLRAIAILTVMAFHVGVPFVEGGALGVDIFFVLSGFLITALLMEEWSETRNISFKKFYLRRALRLFPAVVILVFACVTYAFLFVNPVDRGKYYVQGFAVLGYFANWRRALLGQQSMTPLFSHTWSLSIEEQFYLIWPPLVYGALRLRMKPRQIIISVGLLVTLIWFYRGVLWFHAVSWDRIYNGLDTRLDGLLVGCATAIWVSSDGWQRAALLTHIGWVSTVAGIVLLKLLLWPVFGKDLCLWGWPAIECSVAIILILVVAKPNGWTSRFLGWSVLVWIGQLSYSLYLWHVPVNAWIWNSVTMHIPRFGHFRGIVNITIDTSTAFAVASLSYHIIEKPFLKLKARFH